MQGRSHRADDHEWYAGVSRSHPCRLAHGAAAHDMARGATEGTRERTPAR